MATIHPNYPDRSRDIQPGPTPGKAEGEDEGPVRTGQPRPTQDRPDHERMNQSKDRTAPQKRPDV